MAPRREEPRRVAARAAAAAALLAGACWTAAVAEPSATPQRPSLSFNAWTAPEGAFEIEAGASLSDGTAAAPLFLKYGLVERVEMELGLDAVRRPETPGGHATSIGDAVLGVRARLAGRSGRPALAVAGSVKLPTANEEAGSGEIDAAAAGIVSAPLGRWTLDANAGFAVLGRPDGHAVGQVQLIATLSPPPLGGWSPFVEAAWQSTAGEGDGGFLDAGIAYGASPRVVIDVAAGAGWSEGYPDWQVTIGWTVLFARSAR